MLPIKKLSLPILLVLSIALAGCETTQSGKPNVVASCSPPTDLMLRSPGPHRLPDRALTQKDVVVHWAQDRVDLKVTAQRKNALAGFIRSRC